MPRYAVNISTLLTEYPFFERLDRLAELGFDAVEFYYPYDFTPTELVAHLLNNGLKVVLFNVYAGDMAAGDRGFASDPSRAEEWRRSVEDALKWAVKLSCPQVNVLAGKRLSDIPSEKQWECLGENLRWAASLAETAGVSLNVEALNSVESPGYLICSTADAAKVVRAINRPNLKFQYDVYHMQYMEGNVVNTVRSNLDIIGHIQIADLPGRHEPGTGEIHYPFVFRALDEMGYEGFVSAEYKPLGRSEDSFGWVPVNDRKTRS
jgi:hydroxypyruvate isomerase